MSYQVERDPIRGSDQLWRGKYRSLSPNINIFFLVMLKETYAV